MSIRFSNLSTAGSTVVAGSDLIPVVDISASVTKVVTVAGLHNAVPVSATTLKGRTVSLVDVNTTQAGTPASTVATALSTFNLPANSLSANGLGVRIDAWGTLAANGSAKQIRLQFGNTVVVGSTTTGSATSWRANAVVLRTASTTYEAIGTLLEGANSIVTQATPDANSTAAIAIQLIGQNSSSFANEIVAEGMTVEFLN